MTTPEQQQPRTDAAEALPPTRHCGARNDHDGHVYTHPLNTSGQAYLCDGLSDGRRLRSGETQPCGDTTRHPTHLWTPEGWQTPIACPGRFLDVEDETPTVSDRVNRWMSQALRDTPSKAEVSALVADNDTRLANLAVYGIKADMASIVNLRVQMLCDVLFGTDAEPTRRAFEHALGLRYRAQIDKLEEQGRRMQLAAAGQPPSLLLPGNPHPHGPANGRRRR